MSFRTAPADRKHDLPPLWDGRDVAWSPWETLTSSWRFHATLEDRACHHCGALSERLTAFGKVHPVEGDTVESYQTTRLPSGRTYERKSDVPAWPYLRLVAERCPDCGHDTVWDKDADTSWDLDATDYGNEGSWDPGKTQGTLF